MKRNQIAIALSIVSVIMTLRTMHNVNKLATAEAEAFDVIGDWMNRTNQLHYDDIFVDIVNHMNES